MNLHALTPSCPTAGSSDLNMWNHSLRHRCAKKRMTNIALLPILPCDQHGLTPVLRERDGSALVDYEIIGLDLTPIDQGQSPSIRQHGAPFLHHVQRQTRTPRPIHMEKAYFGI